MSDQEELKGRTRAEQRQARSERATAQAAKYEAEAELLRKRAEAADRLLAELNSALATIEQDAGPEERTKAVIQAFLHSPMTLEAFTSGMLFKLQEGDGKAMQMYLQLLGYLKKEEVTEAAPPTITFNFNTLEPAQQKVASPYDALAEARPVQLEIR